MTRTVARSDQEIDMTNEAVLTTEALSRSDKLDLIELLPPGTAVERVQDLPPGELGEPVTMILVIALSVATLTGISAWLASRGKNVEFSLSLEAPGVKGSVTLKAHGGDTPEQLAAQVRAAGVEVPPS
jgi:hypothetical protein